MNPKGLATSYSTPSPYKNVRKVNVVISLRSGWDIDNQVENFKEPCKFPHIFFQNSSHCSPVRNGSSSKSGDTTNGVLNDSQNDPLSNSTHDQEDPEENDSSNRWSPKHSSSPFGY